MSDAFSTDTKTGDASSLEGLVGDGKKFATNEDLAKGKLEADLFIEKLQDENKQALAALVEAQEKGKDSATVSELLAAVKESQSKSADAGTPQLDEAALVDLVKKTLQGENAADKAARNRNEANSLVLQKVNGDAEAAKAYVAERAKSLGMTPERLGELSEESPSAFAALVGLTPQAVPSKGIGDLKADTNPQALKPENIAMIDGHKTKSHYDALKKEMGIAKFLGTKSIQIEMLKDAQALGMDKFNSK